MSAEVQLIFYVIALISAVITYVRTDVRWAAAGIFAVALPLAWMAADAAFNG